ncbi:hypothetical protein CANARDRAFT_8765 [[Candida] arabinofermentans NRRL YB-2248]|uniref:BZIP domain-containing protein n=1 Tax=[Candida] arabinofermentans NRRL YB-2248 TaxID=983967 RepID=A0A1E4SY48_9ASCO|nr:hypothetical protein CANARDRAFT_8765 [[Candida] arabinofermentans NRRL YB-2248]
MSSTENLTLDASSKPGRKPIQSEPKNKRTAQNRAAQRAFRERKEKKMQELEVKVQLLENEKLQITNETELLRIQVDTLMNELSKFKGPEAFKMVNKVQDLGELKQLEFTQNAPSSSSPSGESDKSSSSSSTPINMNSANTPTSSCSSTTNKVGNNTYEYQFPSGVNNEPGTLMAQIQQEPSLWKDQSSSDFSSGISTGETPDSLYTPISAGGSKDELNQSNFKGDFKEDVSNFCADLSTVCGTKSCPYPKSQKPNRGGPPSTTTGGMSNSFATSSLNSPSVAKYSPFQTLADNVSVAESTAGDRAADAATSQVNDLQFLFDIPSYDNSLVFGASNPNTFTVPNFMNEEFGDLDAANALTGEDSDPLRNLITEESKDDPLSEFFNRQPLLTSDNLNILNQPENSIAYKAENFNQTADDNEDEQVPDTNSNLMKCSQIWERITTHPRFGELDIDGLCHELKSKAKCSESGVVVDGSDVGELLQQAIGKTETTPKDSAVINQFLKGLS